MTTRTRSRAGALALAGLLALVPVAGPVALAPTAAADQIVVRLTEEQAAAPIMAEAVPIAVEAEAAPTTAEPGAEEGPGAPAEEIDYLGSLMLLGATSLISLGSIAMVAYFLFFKKQPMRKNAT